MALGSWLYAVWCKPKKPPQDLDAGEGQAWRYYNNASDRSCLAEKAQIDYDTIGSAFYLFISYFMYQNFHRVITATFSQAYSPIVLLGRT